MKKLMFLAICLMAMMMGCKQKGQKSPENSKDSVTAVIDSIIEENDTTPLPMFLVGNDGKFMQMLYWTNFEEPKKSGDDDEFFETYHKRWELQEMFRRNAAQYTNLLSGDKIIQVKFVDEVLKDPDGNTPSFGEIHSRVGIPSLCARYDYANPKEKPHKQSLIDSWGLVVCTDSYLASRKRLDIQHLQADDYSYTTKLPADIVQKLEAQYGMKAESAVKTCVIDGRYTMGAVQFKGEYKNAPKDKYDPDRKFALALEVLIDSGKVYILEQLGYFDPQYGSSWNADADGYFPNDITASPMTSLQLSRDRRDWSSVIPTVPLRVSVWVCSSQERVNLSKWNTSATIRWSMRKSPFGRKTLLRWTRYIMLTRWVIGMWRLSSGPIATSIMITSGYGCVTWRTRMEPSSSGKMASSS